MSAMAVELQDVRSGAYVPAMLYDSIEERHLRDIEQSWRPELQKVANQLRPAHTHANGQLDVAGFINALGQHDAQDAYWNWRSKVQQAQSEIRYNVYALECGGDTQATMRLDLVQQSRLHSQAGQHLVYVDFLAVAPWNRRRLHNPRRYRGIGSILMITAICLSLDEGFLGRVGLHSLPQAEDFYRQQCQMTDLGADPHKENLRYFELTPDQAAQLLDS